MAAEVKSYAGRGPFTLKASKTLDEADYKLVGQYDDFESAQKTAAQYAMAVIYDRHGVDVWAALCPDNVVPDVPGKPTV